MFRWAAVGALLLAVGACAGPPLGPTDPGPTYSCCAAADVERIYHPGETLAVHWIVQGTPAPSGAVRQIELNVRLDGAFGSVTDLKGGAAAPHSIAAAPVRPTGVAGEQPVSTILIPPTAAPGYYDLVWSITEPGSSVNARSIIQVAAGP